MDDGIKAAGQQYTQSTEPANPARGDRWFDTTSGVLFIYDGTAWRAIPPVTVTDQATAFDGSDGETVELDGCLASGGSVVLQAGSISLGDDNDAANVSSSAEQGVQIEPKRTIGKLSVRIGGNTAWGNASSIKAAIRLSATGDILAETLLEKSVVSSLAGHVISFVGITLEANSLYDVLLMDANQSWTCGRRTSPSWPYENSALTVHTSIPSATWRQAFSEIGEELNTSPTTTGTARVYWPHPPQIEAWQDVVARYSEHNGSVQVDVEQYDGTAWQTMLSDIRDYAALFDLDPSKNVALKFTLTRPTVDDVSPTVDYVARRYTI